MKVKILVVACTCLFNIALFSQNDSSAYQKFYSDFINLYKDTYKPPANNYYEALTKTCNYTFNAFNPKLSAALKEISGNSLIAEKEALDTLFLKVFAQLKTKDIWIGATDIYSDNQDFFRTYNDRICPCYTSKISATDPGEKLLKVLQDCNYAIGKDTAFLRVLLQSNSKHTAKDFIRLQQYFSLYIYANCPVINYHQNESLKYAAAFDQYYNSLSLLKRWEGENVVRYYKNKMLDSLVAIFPQYKKYEAELKTAAKKMEAGNVVLRGSYNAIAAGKSPELSVQFYNGADGFTLFGKAAMKLSANGLDSKIVSFKYSPDKAPSFDREEIIINPVKD